MRKQALLLFSLAAAVILLLSACGPAELVPTPTPDISAPDNAGSGEANQADQQDQDAAPVDSGGETQPEATQPEQPSVALPPLPELGFAHGDSQLKASNPNQLDLTSGELYVVELFAFW